ncbi:serine hydrolase [uncultured Rhodoblastus sp.]|uniref:serine hydrolase n=1 Tax=uncultured Rhodoblastus sp. TaxID=543037 RepID=UPI0025DD96A6|nr:serine hydrolase [uncultured Rhodoblastus sp.]
MFVIATALCATTSLRAGEPARLAIDAAARVQELIPEIETYIESGMKAFDSPALALGVVVDDKVVYARGFGVRSRASGGAVNSRTLFQIGSTTKGFLATTLAIMVDRGKLRWDDRIVDLDPAFQLKDPWVTREFRVFDLLAQRSSLPAYANDSLGVPLGIDETALIHSLRHVEPVSSFRSAFAYTNITHMLAGRIVAKAAGAADWNAVLRAELLDPLGMKESSVTAQAMEQAPNHASGYRWTPQGVVEVPFTQIFPYDFMGAGDINSNIEEMSRWLQLQLGDGVLEGQRLVSAENLAFTRRPEVAITEKAFYAMGWIRLETPNGVAIWHNGGTSSFGAFVGFIPDRKAGIVLLTNEANVGFPDALGIWLLDRILGNEKVDYVAKKLNEATAAFAKDAARFDKPANPRPFPALAPLVGAYVNPAIGKAVLKREGEALVMEIATGGAKLRLDPWDGDVFTATLAPEGRFAAVAANEGPGPAGFVQFQIDNDGKRNRLRMTDTNGQQFEFLRE